MRNGQACSVGMVEVVHQSGLGNADVLSDADAPDLAAVHQLIGGIAANVQHRGQLRDGEDQRQVVVQFHKMYLHIKKVLPERLDLPP